MNPDQQTDKSQKSTKLSYRSPVPILITVVVVSLISLAVWQLFLSQEEGADQPPQPDESEEVVVSITEEGFVPEVLLISPGTTVVWQNEGTEPSWVASNPHPTHDDFPALNAGDPIGPNSAYYFTFDEIGEYDYHDHLNPETNGSIIVEEESETE